MATVDYYIDTDSGSSGGVGTIGDPFDELSTAEAFLDTVDNSANDIIIHCTGATDEGVASSIAFASWSDTPLSLTIQSDDTLSAAWDDDIYSLVGDSGVSFIQILFMNLDCDTTIDGLQIHLGNNGQAAMNLEGNQVNTIINNMIRGDGGTTQRGIQCDDSNATFHVANNVIYDCSETGIEVDGFTGAATLNFYNNTVIDCGEGIEDGGVGAGTNYRIRNNLVQGCTTADYAHDSADVDTFDNNIDEDGTGTDTVSVVFTDETGHDFTTSDSNVTGQGTDLSSLYAQITTDRLGNARGSSWDIGAYQDAGGGGGTILPFIMAYH